MMDWSDVRYALPLHHPPRIQRIGVGAHRLHDTTKHYSHPGHWYAHIYSYEAEVCINGETFPIRPGYAGLIPPQSKVSYQFRGRSTHLFAHFRFESDSQPIQVRAMQDLGSRFLPLADRFYDAVSIFNTNPTRAAARLWEILWEFAEPTPGISDPQGTAPPAVQRIRQIVEQYLARPITVPFLADQVDLSPNHLTHLFRKHLGTTLVAYVRQRRALRAKHLLLHSSLTIKTIAQQVGISDPHLFNKVIRRELGASPKRVREKGAPK